MLPLSVNYLRARACVEVASPGVEPPRGLMSVCCAVQIFRISYIAVYAKRQPTDLLQPSCSTTPGSRSEVVRTRWVHGLHASSPSVAEGKHVHSIPETKLLQRVSALHGCSNTELNLSHRCQAGYIKSVSHTRCSSRYMARTCNGDVGLNAPA